MSAYVGYHVWIYMFLLIVVASATVWHHRYGGRSEGSEAEDVTCDPPWQLLHRSCVQFFKVKPFSTWQDARNVCAQNKAELLCINDKAEKDNVRPLLQEHVKSIDLLNWWVGLSLSANGTWYWVDGQELNKYLIDWAPQSGKTLDDNGEILQNRCGMLNYQGRLTDEDCGQTKPFICERKLVTAALPTTTAAATQQLPQTTSRQPPAPCCNWATMRKSDCNDELKYYKIQYYKGLAENQALEKEILIIKLDLLKAVMKDTSHMTARQLLDLVSVLLDRD